MKDIIKDHILYQALQENNDPIYTHELEKDW